MLERTIARFYGVEAAYTFVSCWNASEAIFPTFCEPGDITDEHVYDEEQQALLTKRLSELGYLE